MRNVKDAFDNQVFLGDKVIYGANGGVRIGVVVKWNPQTIKIKLTSKPYKPQTYICIPYDYYRSLMKIDSLHGLDYDILDDEEKDRIAKDKLMR